MMAVGEILATFGLAQARIGTIGAEKAPGFPNYRVKIECPPGDPIFMEVGHARQLLQRLQHIGEKNLSPHLELAINAAAKGARQWAEDRRPQS